MHVAKAYEDAVHYLGSAKFNAYMGGANDTRVSGADIIAYVYGKKLAVVEAAIDGSFERILAAYNKRFV